MAEPKSKRHARGAPGGAGEEEGPEPLEAGLHGPSYAGVERVEELDAAPDEYLLLKVVEANRDHHRTMRWGLGLGTLVVLFHVTLGRLAYPGAGLAADLAVFLVAGALLGAGLHGLQRQLELLRRAVAATDHFVFGPPERPKG